ncbi:MAG TPA: TlpA disulfide reductase family protein [Luteibaculaceae bacterium]|nr:TlpA disulfide reductase family protein [Luteibaculaceae bacterium]
MKSLVPLSALSRFCWLLAILIVGACGNDPVQLPAVQAKTISGESITNQKLVGKWVVIKLWATWCGPCLAEMDELNALQEQYARDTNVVFIGITDEPTDVVEATLSVQPFNYRVIADAKTLKKSLQSGVVGYIPEHQIYDPTGRQIFSVSEPGPNIAAVIDSILKKNRN